MAVAPERGGSSAAAEGVVPTGLRRVPAREGKEGVACRVGSSTFLRHCDVVGVVIISFSSPLLPLLPFSFSRSFWSQRVFARSGRLRRSLPRSSGTHLFEVARVVLLPRPLSVRLVLTRSFDATLPVSIHLRILLRSFVRSLAVSHGFRGREISPSTIAHACTLVPSFSLFPFLPLRIGKQSARCLLSSHSTCLLTQASCPRSISLVVCA